MSWVRARQSRKAMDAKRTRAETHSNASQETFSTLTGGEPATKAQWSIASVTFSDRAPGKGDSSDPVHGVLQERGEPLDAGARRHFEKHFGHDLGNVRVHSGDSAQEAASSIGAAAFTVGSNIVFARNRYAPGTLRGRLLLQHELRHVEQQRSARKVERPVVDNAGSLHENQARSLLDPRVTPLAEQSVQLAPEGEFSIGSGIVDSIGSSAFGDTSWPFLKAVFEGFVNRLQKDVQAGRAEKAKDHLKDLLKPWNALKFYGGYLLGLLLGLISPITDLVKGVIGLIKLAGSAIVWLAKWSPIGVAVSPERQAKIQRLQEKFVELGAEFANSLAEFAKNPRESVKRLKDFLDNLMTLALGQAREIGAKAADAIFDFLDKAFFDMGQSIGEVIGAAIAQVLLLVFSDAIGNLISKAGAFVGKLAEFVAGKAVEVFEWVKGFTSEVVGLLRRAVKGALKLFEGLANKAIEAFDALKALFMESEALDVGAQKVAAGAGRVEGPLPNVMESRMVTGKRTSPATVADLRPPKVHPSNIGKEVHGGKSVGKKPDLGKAPFDEPLTPSERGLTKEQLRQKHILEDVGERQSQASDVASKEVEKAPGQQQRGKVRAGIKRPPKHHVFPQELEEKEKFFSKRGFTGDHHIDNYTVELEQARHEAVHGGGDYKLGRTTGFEWNTKVRTVLEEEEAKRGRMLKRDEIIKIVEGLMKKYKIPRKYVKYQ